VTPPLDDALLLLELDRGSTLADAKKARRDLAMVWHPDRFADNDDLRQRAEDKLKAINLAYETVTDYFRVTAKARPALAAPAAPAIAAENARKTVTLDGVPIHERALQSCVGIAVGTDAMGEVIAAGTTVPCAVAKTFTNARDFQTELTIRLLHGAPGAPASEASPLGRVTFVDLPPGPRGFMRMQVVFAVDENGTVAIGATDLDSGDPVLATAA